MPFMASAPEHRGESVRITWLLGGRRGAPKQSCTFTGPPEARLKLALAAKELVEARGHCITRDECYAAVLGDADEPPDLVPTFQQWVPVWIAQLRARKAARPEVINRYEKMLNLRAMPFFGGMRLTAITHEQVKTWVLGLRSSRVTYGGTKRREGKRALKPNTVIFMYVVLTTCLGAAVPRWLTVNPAARLPGEKRSDLGLPPEDPSPGMFLTADEVAVILGACEPALFDLVYVASRTGMRVGELVQLQCQHVVFPRGGGATILVRGEVKTPASKRDIPVSGRSVDILRRRVAGRRPSDAVFRCPAGKAWGKSNLRQNYWDRTVAKARRCAEHPPPPPPKSRSGPTRRLRPDEVSTCDCVGVLKRRPRFHDLRHTHVSVLIFQGWHFKKIQRRIGHAKFETTMNTYGHLFDLGNEDELAGLEDFFDSAGASATRRRGRPGSSLRHVRRVHARVVRVRR